MASGSSIRAGKAFVEAYLDDTRLERGLRAAQRKLQSFGAGVAKIGAGVAGLGASILAPLTAAVMQFAKTGDELDKMSARTGVSVEALSTLGFAAEQSGADLATLENGIKGMQRGLEDARRGLSTATDNLDALGLSLSDLEGLSPENQFKVLADRISRIDDPSRQAALAMKVFGRAGQQLIPMLKGGAAGIQALQDQADEFALTIGENDTKAAAAFTDSLNLLWRVVKRGVFGIGAGLAPVITDLATRIAKIGATVVQWIDQNRQLVIMVAKVAAGLVVAGGVISAIGAGIIALGAVLGAGASIVGAFGTAIGAVAGAIGFVLSPLGLVAAAVAAVGVWFVKTTDVTAQAMAWLQGQFGKLASVATDAFGAIRDSLAAGDIESAANVLWAGLNLVWQKGVGGLERMFIHAKSAIFGVWREVQIGLAGMFLKTIGALQQAWAGFSGFVQKRWADDQNAIAKGVVGVMAYFDDTIDADEAKQILDDQHAAKVKGIDEATAKRSAEIEAGLRDQLDTLAEMQAEQDGSALSRLDAELREAGKGLADAQAAFDATLKGSPRGAAREGGAQGDSPLASLLNSLGSGAGISPAISGGTFSSMAGRMFGGGDDVAKQQLAALKEIALAARGTERNTREGGLTFAQ